jgi:hypothetical protein
MSTPGSSSKVIADAGDVYLSYDVSSATAFVLWQRILEYAFQHCKGMVQAQLGIPLEI